MTTSSSFKVIDRLKKGLKKLEVSETEHVDKSEELLLCYSPHLTPAIIEEARNHLNETEEGKEKALAEFRKLIEGEKNLVTPTDDMFLLAFLRARKFNLKRAFRLFQKYWSFRRDYRDIYDNLYPDKVKALILRSFTGFLHYRDNNGAIVFILKIGDWNPDIDTYETLFSTITAFLVYTLEFPATHIAGFRIIVDLRNVTWRQIKYFTPTNILLVVKSTQSCFPARFKAIHVVSDNKMLALFWTMVYPLLSPKLKQRVYVHNQDMKGLTQFIKPSVLPVEYGGEAPVFDNSEWDGIIDSYRDKILHMAKCGYQE